MKSHRQLFYLFLFAFTLILIGTHTKSVAQGNALNLDGVEDYLVTPHLGVELKEKTMEAWVKLNDINHMGGGVIGIDINYSMPHMYFDAISYNETNNGWMLSSEFFKRTTVAGSGVKETSTNEWVHLAVTYKDYDYSLYRNGTLIHQRTVDTAVVFPTNSNIIIGQRHSNAGGSDLNAVIDEVRVWNIARDSMDIQATMNCSCAQMGAVPSNGLLACYTFDDFGADPVEDITGNGFHASFATDAGSNPTYVVSTAPISECATSKAIPTLGEWGIIILSLTMMIFGVLTIRHHLIVVD